jgi:hypothetical protein
MLSVSMLNVQFIFILMLSVAMPSVTFYCHVECCYVEYHIFGMLSVAMPSVAFFIVMVSVDVMKV